jgi:hypothetical protein
MPYPEAMRAPRPACRYNVTRLVKLVESQVKLLSVVDCVTDELSSSSRLFAAIGRQCEKEVRDASLSRSSANISLHCRAA